MRRTHTRFANPLAATASGTNDFAYPLDSMQKSYTIQGGEHRLCVRVEMPHSHADGWAPDEIGRFADQLFGVGEDVSPLPVVVESGCEEDGGALTCTVECSGAPLEDVQLCYSRADGCKHSRRMPLPLAADDTQRLVADWADRKYNQLPIDSTLWSPSADNRTTLRVPVPSGCVAFLTLTDAEGMLCATPHVDTRGMAKWAARL